MNPEISIIIPFYNTNKLTLRRSINSLINQSFKNFEILVVNDGSSIDYSDLKKEYAEKDKRVIFIDNEHCGVSKARNTGLECAKGNYIGFVDSDDYVEECYLSKLYTAIQDSDIAICGVLITWFPTFERWEDRRLFFSQPSRYNGLQYINFCCNKLFKAKIIKENNIKFDEKVKLGEDALFLNEYFKFCNSFRCIKNLLYYYDKNFNSATNNYNSEFWEYEKLVIETQWHMFHQYPLSKNEEDAMICWLYRKFKDVLYYYIDKELNKKFQRELMNSIILHPLFKIIINSNINNNIHLNNNDHKILKIWKYLGVNGIYITRIISKNKNILTASFLFRT